MPNQGVSSFSGVALRSHRLGRGLSQASLGRLVGVRPGTIIAWESGRQRPTARRISDIAVALGADRRVLLSPAAGSSLRDLRQQAGLTGHAAAETVGVGASWLYAVERGEQPMSKGLRRALARAYSVTEDAAQAAYDASPVEPQVALQT